MNPTTLIAAGAVILALFDAPPITVTIAAACLLWALALDTRAAIHTQKR